MNEIEIRYKGLGYAKEGDICKSGDDVLFVVKRGEKFILINLRNGRVYKEVKNEKGYIDVAKNGCDGVLRGAKIIIVEQDEFKREGY